MTVDEDPKVKLRSMCETCAYRAGTEPNLDGFTRAKAWAAEELGEPFLCHANRDMAGDLLDGEPPAMCAGFYEVLQRRIAEGYYKQMRPERKRLIQIISDGLDEIGERVDAAIRTEQAIKKAVGQ